MRIAVEGCMHGELDTVYRNLLDRQEKEKIKIDLLVCCGDFQAVRNVQDLACLSVPDRYRKMHTFWKYYSGEMTAPIPTIFIGGNHEASNYLSELYYGGWAAPNIYFLGYAGIVKFGNIRIGGLSGIYKPNHYYSGHFEKLPYNESDIRSIYHIREYDTHKLMQVEEPVDIFLSHDWPLNITDWGDSKDLMIRKNKFKHEIRERRLGNPAAAKLMEKLKPSYWFSAHLHCKFHAHVKRGVDGPDTKFLALDKCDHRRHYLEIFDIESEPGPYELHYDEEWLAITRKFNPIFPRTRSRANFSDAKLDINDCRRVVRNNLQKRGYKPFEFVRTAPRHTLSRELDTNESRRVVRNQFQNRGYRPYEFVRSAPSNNVSQSAANNFPRNYRNPQTEAFLQLLLEHEDGVDTTATGRSEELPKNSGPVLPTGSVEYKYEDIDIGDEDED